MDTIFAPASARGKAGVAIVRLSGPNARAAVQAFGVNLPAARRAGLRRLMLADGTPLDDALVLWFEAGASFTGEEVAELHLHGSQATVNAVLHALSDQPGLRLAEPGEFTRRALENDRLDLAQVEGLGDLIEAETEAQRRQALKVLAGALGAKAETWRASLIRAAALLEATIDFADEEVPVDVAPDVRALLVSVAHELEAEIAGVAVAERIRDGFEVAIVGAPNAGKSTLLNALAGREAAITSEHAGTTRDVIEVRMDLRGLPVTVLDTAGLRDSDDVVENIGIDRAKARAGAADLRVFLLDGPDAAPVMVPQPDDVVILGKADLQSHGGLAVSGKTGEGVDALVGLIAQRLEQRAGLAATATRERHRVAMVRALASMSEAGNRIRGESPDTELAAEDVRSAIRALDSLVGRVDVEHILGEIFASFCIGK